MGKIAPYANTLFGRESIDRLDFVSALAQTGLNGLSKSVMKTGRDGERESERAHQVLNGTNCHPCSENGRDSCERHESSTRK